MSSRIPDSRTDSVEDSSSSSNGTNRRVQSGRNESTSVESSVSVNNDASVSNREERSKQYANIAFQIQFTVPILTRFPTQNNC